MYYVKQLDTVVSGVTLMHAGVPVLMPEMTDYANVVFDICKVRK
jgi:hypothetical protein